MDRALHPPPGQSPPWWAVHEIINPAYAFHALKQPILVHDPAIEKRLDYGRLVHELLAPMWFRQMAGYSASEAPIDGAGVGLGGIRGRIDVRIGHRIIELKTAHGPPPVADRLLLSYAQDVEQTILYALMTARQDRVHSLLYFNTEWTPVFRAFDLSLVEPAALHSYFRERKWSLDSAVRFDDPTALGCCRYRDAGCDFRIQGRCHCDDLEPIDTGLVATSVKLTENESLATEFEAARAKATMPGRRTIRFWDLFRPRQAFRDLTAGSEASGGVYDESYTLRLWMERKILNDEASGESFDLKVWNAETGQEERVGRSLSYRLSETKPHRVETRSIPLLFRVGKGHPTPGRRPVLGLPRPAGGALCSDRRISGVARDFIPGKFGSNRSATDPV